LRIAACYCQNPNQKHKAICVPHVPTRGNREQIETNMSPAMQKTSGLR
jgi:hypothetical protein